MSIKVTYRSCDGFSKSRSFKTLKGAQAFAQHYVGKHPELGSGYAVSSDGIGLVYVSGFVGDYAVRLADLFPAENAYAEHIGHLVGALTNH